MDFGSAVSQKGFNVKDCADRFLVYSSKFQTLKIYNSYSVTGTIPAYNTNTFIVDPDSNILVRGSHGLNNGDIVTLSSDGTLPGGLSEGTEYYVVNNGGYYFQVSLTPGGSVVDITSSGTGTHTFVSDTIHIKINHNLGYIAPFIAVYNGTTTLGTDNSYFFCDSQGYSMGVDWWDSCRNTENTLTITINYGWESGAYAGETIYFTVYIFLDDFRTVSEQTINSGISSGESSSDYGIRISKSGFDAKNCSDVNCIMSSSFFSQIIHKKGVITATTDDIYTITHDLSIFPSIFCFHENTTSSGINFAPVTIENNNINYYLSTGEKLYYIIFKQKNG